MLCNAAFKICKDFHFIFTGQLKISGKDEHEECPGVKKSADLASKTV